MKSYEMILPYIPTGEKNAKKHRTILQETGFHDRVTRKMYEEARRDEILICASDKGFFFPESTEEAARWLRMATHKALSILATTTPIRRWLKSEGYYDVKGQMSLTDYAEQAELSDALTQLDAVLGKLTAEKNDSMEV